MKLRLWHLVLILIIAIFVASKIPETQHDKLRKAAETKRKAAVAQRAAEQEKILAQQRRQARAKLKIDKSPEMQAGRQKLIDNLIAEGIFARVTLLSKNPRVWVTGRFHALDFKNKEKFISVVYCYYFNGRHHRDMVVLKDNLTGKEIGHYSQDPFTNRYYLKMK